MDIVSAIQVLRRQWVVVLLGILVTVAGLAFVVSTVPPTWTVVSQGVLIVPAPAASADGTVEDPSLKNPYLGLGGLQPIAEVIARSMNTPDAAAGLDRAGATELYVVDIVPGESPSISVTVTSQSEAAALSSARIITDAVARTLQARQVAEGTPKASLVVIRPVVAPDDAVRSGGSQLRGLAGVGVVGLAVTVLAAFLREGWYERRRRATADSVQELSFAALLGDVDRSDWPGAGLDPSSRGSSRRGAATGPEGISGPPAG